MRVLMLTRTTPHPPTHDRARLVPASLLAHLAEQHRDTWSAVARSYASLWARAADAAPAAVAA
jgi:hypothetical protein